jgi:S-(hydroxymethyl)glutathione dehydrogenase/alcohol dehydrogenase
MMQLLQHGEFDLTRIITHRMALAETPAAYDLFRTRGGGVLKVVLAP